MVSKNIIESKNYYAVISEEDEIIIYSRHSPRLCIKDP